MKDRDLIILISDFLKKSLEHERILAHLFSVSRPTIQRWASGQNFPHPVMWPVLIKEIKNHDCKCKCGTIREGRISFLWHLGERGGYGVIVDKNNNQYTFTLSDVEDYSGGDLARAGYLKGALIEFSVGSDAKVNQVKLIKKRGTR